MMCVHCSKRWIKCSSGLCAKCAKSQQVRLMYANLAKIVCRHCLFRVLAKPRGLCNVCFQDRNIRNQYSVSPFWTRKDVNDVFSDRLTYQEIPDFPVAANPGTEEKIRAMIERRSKGQGLFHPDDGRRHAGN